MTEHEERPASLTGQAQSPEAGVEMSRETSPETGVEMSQETGRDPVRILAIESSCDETAAAVVENGRKVLSSVIYSQIETHTVFGGVVPEIASRKHIEKINQVVDAALKESGIPLRELSAVAVTMGPGLVGPLLIGVSFAKALAFAEDLPLLGVNHIEGHVSANFIAHPDLEPPFLCLIVSGGHTHLVVVEDYGRYRLVGRTRDDAAGEAFDKVARSVGLGYPGGPKVDAEAKKGNPDAMVFPKAKVHDAPYDFSFSGLKSAVLNFQNHAAMTGEQYSRADLVASFQKACVDVLVEHTIAAAKDLKIRKIAMAGGVASNSCLRATMQEACRRRGFTLCFPPPVLCTDNAAMIGAAAYYRYLRGEFSGLDLNAVPGLKLEMIPLDA